MIHKRRRNVDNFLMTFDNTVNSRISRSFSLSVFRKLFPSANVSTENYLLSSGIKLYTMCERPIVSPSQTDKSIICNQLSIRYIHIDLTIFDLHDHLHS